MVPAIGIDLVTGGAGFIGSHLVDRLLTQGRSVRVFDSFVVGRQANLKQHNGNSRLEILEGDVADAAAVAAASAGVERVFHLAARADIVPSIQEPEAYFRSNVDGTFCVLEAARRQGVKRLVYVASSSCYGIPAHYPTAEIGSSRSALPLRVNEISGRAARHALGPGIPASGGVGAVSSTFMGRVRAPAGHMVRCSGFSWLNCWPASRSRWSAMASRPGTLLSWPMWLMR